MGSLKTQAWVFSTTCGGIHIGKVSWTADKQRGREVEKIFRIKYAISHNLLSVGKFTRIVKVTIIKTHISRRQYISEQFWQHYCRSLQQSMQRRMTVRLPYGLPLRSFLDHGHLPGHVTNSLYHLQYFIPSLSICWRRLQDVVQKLQSSC